MALSPLLRPIPDTPRPTCLSFSPQTRGDKARLALTVMATALLVLGLIALLGQLDPVTYEVYTGFSQAVGTVGTYALLGAAALCFMIASASYIAARKNVNCMPETRAGWLRLSLAIAGVALIALGAVALIGQLEPASGLADFAANFTELDSYLIIGGGGVALLISAIGTVISAKRAKAGGVKHDPADSDDEGGPSFKATAGLPAGVLPAAQEPIQNHLAAYDDGTPHLIRGKRDLVRLAERRRDAPKAAPRPGPGAADGGADEPDAAGPAHPVGPVQEPVQVPPLQSYEVGGYRYLSNYDSDHWKFTSDPISAIGSDYQSDPYLLPYFTWDAFRAAYPADPRAKWREALEKAVTQGKGTLVYKLLDAANYSDIVVGALRAEERQEYADMALRLAVGGGFAFMIKRLFRDFPCSREMREEALERLLLFERLRPDCGFKAIAAYADPMRFISEHLGKEYNDFMACFPEDTTEEQWREILFKVIELGSSADGDSGTRLALEIFFWKFRWEASGETAQAFLLKAAGCGRVGLCNQFLAQNYTRVSYITLFKALEMEERMRIPDEAGALKANVAILKRFIRAAEKGQKEPLQKLWEEGANRACLTEEVLKFAQARVIAHREEVGRRQDENAERLHQVIDRYNQLATKEIARHRLQPRDAGAREIYGLFEDKKREAKESLDRAMHQLNNEVLKLVDVRFWLEERIKELEEAARPRYISGWAPLARGF